MTPTALTIAGSDPSGGAGLQADLKTFHQHQVYGMSVVTLLTVQNTKNVFDVKKLNPEFVAEQLTRVIEDIVPSAAKTGALGSREIIELVAHHAAGFKFPLVVDPVMISKHGAPLMDDNAVDSIRQSLVKTATIVTPNLDEARVLCQMKKLESVDDMKKAAEILCNMGAEYALIKGGHLQGKAVDLLGCDQGFFEYQNERIDTKHTHGTGCVFSAAIAARLALGNSVLESVSGAKKFITRAIETNPGLGGGFGPTNTFASTDL